MMSFLYGLLSEPEGENLEFKSARSTIDTDIVIDYCVALANEGGGRLVLGVSDARPRRIVGTHAYADGLNKVKERLASELRLRIEVEEALLPEGRVLVFRVPSRPIGVPLHRNGRYLMRAGEALVGMTPDKIQRILDESGPDYSAEKVHGANLSDLDPEAIADFRRRWSEKSGRRDLPTLSDEQALRDTEMIVDGKVTVAAMVLFGTREALGRLGLGHVEVIFEYRANDAPGPAQQREEFRQGFFGFYERLWQLVDLRNTKQSFQDGFFVHDIKTFN